MVQIIFRKKKSKIQIPQITVGVCGYSRNSGVTNFCLCLANYFANKCLLPTAYIEANPTREISMLNYGQKQNFSYMGIDFYPEVKNHSIHSLFSQDYSYVVLDLGVYNTANIPILNGCTYQFMVCNLSPWKINCLDNFIKNYNTRNFFTDNLTILGNPGTLQYDKALRPKIKFHYEPVPYFPNPFQITSDNLDFFNKILQ